MSTNTDYEEINVACAFCAQIDLLLMDDDDKYYVLCLNCRACGPCEDSKELAMVAWCERPDPTNPYTTFSRAARTVLLG